MAEQHDASDRFAPLRNEPVHRLVEPVARFLHVEAASGFVLLACSALALVLANSPLAEGFLGFWKTPLGFAIGSFEIRESVQHWINDGAMVIFFFVIGLEVKRELVLGELKSLQVAALPIAAALGGMIVPASLYLLMQSGEPGERGWGIPMATDIAFVVGCMAVLGRRVPNGLRILLLSLAIADDMGAILVIAIGYTEAIHVGPLAGGVAGIGIVFALARLGVRSLAVYCVAGLLVWFAFHESGVHATIAGVVLGFMTPARSYLQEGPFGDMLAAAREVFYGGGWQVTEDRAVKVRRLQRAARETISPLEYLEDLLHPWVGFVIMPVFALANAGVPLRVSDAGHPVAWAVMLGLFVGKPAGIVLFSWIAVKLKLAKLPSRVGWGLVAGGGALAGIGFTMALFIATLALEAELLVAAKIGILAGSLLSACVGMALLGLLPVSPRKEA